MLRILAVLDAERNQTAPENAPDHRYQKSAGPSSSARHQNYLCRHNPLAIEAEQILTVA